MTWTALLPALLFLASCQPAERQSPPVAAATDPSQAVPKLEGVPWSLLSLGELAIVPSAQQPAPTMLLDSTQHRVSGNTGCNQYSGPYEVTPDSLRFGPLIATRRACLEQALNQRETVLLRALGDTRAWRISGDTLVLTGTTGDQVRFLPTPPAP